jgi:hypothetical protein
MIGSDYGRLIAGWEYRPFLIIPDTNKQEKA